MTSILTPSQAEAVIAVARTLAVVGGTALRISLDGGLVRLRRRATGEIYVRRIDESGKVLAQRKYSDIAHLARTHQEDE